MDEACSKPQIGASEMGQRWLIARLTCLLASVMAMLDLLPTAVAEISVARWQMHEFALRGETRAVNRFRDTAVVGEFTSPSGKLLVVDGFHDGDDLWRLRFTP